MVLRCDRWHRHDKAGVVPGERGAESLVRPSRVVSQPCPRDFTRVVDLEWFWFGLSVLRQLCVTIRFDDLSGVFREGSVDLDGDSLERAVAGELEKALMQEFASAIEIAALTRQPCLEERQLRPAEGGVLGHLVKPVSGVVVR